MELDEFQLPCERQPPFASNYSICKPIVQIVLKFCRFYPPSFLSPKKTKNPNPSPIGNRFGFFLFGGRGWIRTTEAESSRFTVCPHWPLGNTPIFSFCNPWIACIYYHPDGSLSTSFAEFLDFCAESKNTKAKAAQESTFLSGFLELVTGVEPATH